ncbi:Gfo/Idh/MocA family oxidoreductase [Paraburkholderia sp. MMS20-SJTR3]|uniref:Gfo/Idh/MocA family oxidoreductase n=1 Tax=Paraburkholderia sejongensis TaxID=2886946 RepID=A0ABS8JUS0_9BURK|nr:Gfo/Idh/MocA family oxidoreductase [Paraburkholderia sp. MMS20-SJTR3]MCC8393588.1 Gfo/Idh/MocA family oxidoreductase [Paraburkholderia sp. MMS20-SJTR3]
MKQSIRLGMVGGGEGAFIGAVHRVAARLDGEYRLVAGAFASDADRSRAAGMALGIEAARAYPNWQAMLEAERALQDGIEAVAIVTPNHLHARVARDCLERGLHVLCDKPLAATFDEAIELANLARDAGSLFCVTYTYCGFPLVREARELVAAGELGEIRAVQVRYAQDWLSAPIETAGNRQAAWRSDPSQAGEGGCIADIGTHAYHLARFVSGLEPQALLADLASVVPGRRLDDNAQVLLRYANGARGMLWASQTAPGNANNLELGVYGSRGGITWRQEQPDELWFTPLGDSPRVLRRGASNLRRAAAVSTRVPMGHPEGYLEAFANLYTDFAAAIRSRRTHGTDRTQHVPAFPTIDDGLDGMRFVHTALASSRAGGVWMPLRGAASR